MKPDTMKPVARMARSGIRVAPSRIPARGLHPGYAMSWSVS
jgi:hypothetical protein